MKVFSHLFLAAAALLATGCGILLHPLKQPNKAWQLDNPVVHQKTGGKTSAWVGAVEFDDQGEMWSHEQLRTVTAQIRKDARRGPVVLIIFAHGWNNSAQPQDPAKKKNYEQFSRTIAALASAYDTTPFKDYQPTVAGVYLGWRGRVFKRSTAIDFYNRMQNANRVGGLAATEAILDCARAARTNPSSQAVLVGHSFGSIVVENAVNKVLMDSVLRSHYAGGGTVDSPFSLVVLVNSAMPSIVPHQFITSLKSRGAVCTLNGREMPLVLSVTSETDWATKFAFPFGINVGRANPLDTSIGGQYRRNGYADDRLPGTRYTLSQRATHWKAGAHNEQLRSHEMVASDNPTDSDKRQAVAASTPAAVQQKDASLVDLIAGNVNIDEPVRGPVEVLGTHRFSITRKDAAYNDTPYWMIPVPPTFIDKHNGLWDNGNLAALIARLLSHDPSSVKPRLNFSRR